MPHRPRRMHRRPPGTTARRPARNRARHPTRLTPGGPRDAADLPRPAAASRGAAPVRPDPAGPRAAHAPETRPPAPCQGLARTPRPGRIDSRTSEGGPRPGAHSTPPATQPRIPAPARQAGRPHRRCPPAVPSGPATLPSRLPVRRTRPDPQARRPLAPDPTRPARTLWSPTRLPDPQLRTCRPQALRSCQALPNDTQWHRILCLPGSPSAAPGETESSPAPTDSRQTRRHTPPAARQSAHRRPPGPPVTGQGLPNRPAGGPHLPARRRG